jgi:hypothetical protein
VNPGRCRVVYFCDGLSTFRFHCPRQRTRAVVCCRAGVHDPILVHAEFEVLAGLVLVVAAGRPLGDDFDHNFRHPERPHVRHVRRGGEVDRHVRVPLGRVGGEQDFCIVRARNKVDHPGAGLLVQDQLVPNGLHLLAVGRIGDV